MSGDDHFSEVGTSWWPQMGTFTWPRTAASSSYSSTAKVIAADQAAAVLLARWAVMTGR
jgi:hypothetical protein